MKTIVHIIIFSLFFCILCAQKRDSVSTSITPHFSFGFNAGVVGNISKNKTPTDYTNYWLLSFRTIAPNNKYLHDNFSNCDTMIWNNNSNFNANIFVSFPIKTVKWIDIELKNIVIFNTKERESISFRERDTSHWSHYNFEFRGNNVGIEISPLFYFNKLKILYPYIGISAGVAYAYNNRLITKYNPSGNLTDQGEWLMVPLNKNTQVETTKLKCTMSYYLSVPFGLSLKRIKKRTHISPFIDFRYGIKFEKYPTVNYEIVHTIYAQAGLKLSFFKYINKKAAI